MRPFVLRALLFAALLGGAVLGLGALDNLRRFDEANKVRLIAAPDSLDVLCVGSSYTYSGLYTPAFAKTPDRLRAYNYGFSAAGPKVYHLVLADYLRRCTQKPKLVLLNVSLISFCPSADAFVSYPIHRYLTPALTPWQLWAQGYATWADAQTMQARAVGTGLQNAFLAIVGREQDSDLVPQTRAQAGFYANNAVCTDSTLRKDSALYVANFGNAQFSNASLQALISQAKELESQGIKVLLHEIPSYKLSAFFTAEYLAAYNAAWQTFKAQGLQTLRCPAGLAVPDSAIYYRNTDHLNTAGAKRYTQWLLEALKAY